MLEPKKINLSNNVNKYEIKGLSKFRSENFCYDINYSGPTLTASGALSRIKIFCGIGQIREISELEAFLYMGFSKQDYENVKKTNLINKNRMIFLMGNSISIQVLEKIFENLKF